MRDRIAALDSAFREAAAMWREPTAIPSTSSSRRTSSRMAAIA